jgi:hypothetical protein
MSKPEAYEPSLQKFLKALNFPIEKKLKIKGISQRIKELSVPKKVIKDNDEDFIGPGSYEPRYSFLSTKNATPTIKISKSLRFKALKYPPILISTLRNTSPKGPSFKSFNLNDVASSPGYTFKRTGHNLKLVENPSFPGVGKYSPEREFHNKSYTFHKSKREFNWRSYTNQLVKIAKFDRQYVNN